MVKKIAMIKVLMLQRYLYQKIMVKKIAMINLLQEFDNF